MPKKQASGQLAHASRIQSQSTRLIKHGQGAPTLHHELPARPALARPVSGDTETKIPCNYMSSLLLKTQRAARVEGHNSSQCRMLLMVILILGTIVRCRYTVMSSPAVEATPVLGGPAFTVNGQSACRALRKGLILLKLLQGMVSSQLGPKLRFHLQPWGPHTLYFGHSGEGEELPHFGLPVPGW